MSQSLRIVFEAGVGLFQCILLLRFVRGCLGFREGAEEKTAVRCLYGGALAAALGLLRLFPVFKGVGVLTGYLGSLGFSVWLLEGSVGKKCVLSLLLPLAAATGEQLAASLWRQLLPGAESVFLSAFVENTVLLAVWYCARSCFWRKGASFSKREQRLIYAQLAVSDGMVLLLYYAGEGSLPLSIAAVGVLFWIFAFFALLDGLHKSNREELEARLIQQEKESNLRMEELSHQYEQLQKVRHDFNNTLSVIRTLNAERKPDRIDAYIGAYLDEVRVSATFIASENEYVSAIINAKAAQARAAGIEVKLLVDSAIAAENPVDICNVIGNLFDNAITACQKVISGPRISLHIYRDAEATVLCMKNTIQSSVLEYNPQLCTEKADKQGHGYGTKIIQEVAAKYRGFADFYEESGEFCCNVVLYL